MQYTKLKNINKYKSENINPAKTPDTVFEMYSVPIYETGHPEYLRGSQIASNKAVVEKNDILVCKINPRINRVWIVSDESDNLNIASSEWIVVRNNEYNPEFLAWYFRTPRFQKLMTSEVTGIGGSLTRAQPKSVAEYPVPVLDRNTQNEIVARLNKCKIIIDSKEQELEQLDTLVKSRFVEMFGDIITGKYNYKIRKLGDVAFIGSSHRVFTTEFVESGIPFYRGTEIGELANGIEPSEPYYISEEHYNKLTKDNTKPRIGDLLMPSICNKGQIWMVDTDRPFYYKDGRVLCISPNRDIFNSKYLEYFMRIKTLVEYPKLGSGSTFAEFKIFLLKDMDVLVPPRNVQNQFADFVASVDKSKSKIQKSLEETQLLFDSLMQKYFG
jgi:type I restriction enzyme S subunit